MVLSKKIFIASSAILAVVLIFWGIYNLSFKAAPATDSEPIATEDPNTPPVSQPKTSAGILPISDEAVLAPFIDLANSTIKYYSKTTGQVYQVDFDGKGKRVIAEKSLPGLSGVLWSADGTKVITSFTQGTANKFYFYDYTTNLGVPLKDNLDTVIWQNSNKIFYKYYDPESKERSLNIADPNGSNWLKITDLGYRNISIATIPRTGLVSFWNSPDASFETDFESSPVIGGEKKVILKGHFGADYLWSPNGTNVLVSHSDQKDGHKMQLAVMNDRGGEFKNLDIATLVSKCAWSKDNKTFYYALPGAMPDTAILPNDYQNGTLTTQDSFWKFNVITGEKTRLLTADKITGGFDAAGLFLNADESMLFFVNKLDGKLYRIDL